MSFVLLMYFLRPRIKRASFTCDFYLILCLHNCSYNHKSLCYTHFGDALLLEVVAVKNDLVCNSPGIWFILHIIVSRQSSSDIVCVQDSLLSCFQKTRFAWHLDVKVCIWDNSNITIPTLVQLRRTKVCNELTQTLPM